MVARDNTIKRMKKAEEVAAMSVRRDNDLR
jgi:hypothetical protein